jgi:hypothetical protein
MTGNGGFVLVFWIDWIEQNEVIGVGGDFVLNCTSTLN